MMMTKDELSAQSIRLDLEITGDPRMISIQPFIEADSDRDHTLIVSLEVDSMEMIGSARIPLKTGKNRVPFLQDVRIFHPNLWNPKGYGISSTYQVSAIFYQAGKAVWRIDKEVAICFPSTGPEKKYYLNGNPVELIRVPDDFPLQEKGIPMQPGNGNLVLLSDTDPDWEQKLTCCSHAGIMGLLKLSGAEGSLPGFYPGACFVTAEPGSTAEQYCQELCRKGNAVYISLVEFTGFPTDHGKELSCHAKTEN